MVCVTDPRLIRSHLTLPLRVYRTVTMRIRMVERAEQHMYPVSLTKAIKEETELVRTAC